LPVTLVVFLAANRRDRGNARPDRHFAIYRAAAATESIIGKSEMTLRENIIATSAPASSILIRLAECDASKTETFPLRRNTAFSVISACVTVAKEASDETLSIQFFFDLVNMASGRAQPIERADSTTRQPPTPGSDIFLPALPFCSSPQRVTR
jgi:hypothetical protein